MSIIKQTFNNCLVSFNQNDSYTNLHELAKAYNRNLESWIVYERKFKVMQSFLNLKLIDVLEKRNVNGISATWGKPIAASFLLKWINETSKDKFIENISGSNVLVEKEFKPKIKVVYVLVQHSENACKIGFTNDFETRMLRYNTHNPFLKVYRLYADVDIHFEQELHKLLSDYRLKFERAKEWYEFRPEVIEIIEKFHTEFIQNFLK